MISFANTKIANAVQWAIDRFSRHGALSRSFSSAVLPAGRSECRPRGRKRLRKTVGEALTLIFTGDLMQHMPQVFAARQRDGSFDYTSCFSRLNNYFSSADFVIANLETTLGEEPYSGYPRFRSPDALAGAMRRAG